MAVTTFADVRDQEIGLIEAASPLTQSGVKYRRTLGESDFRLWAEQNPAGVMRRFSVQDLFEYDEPLNINTERALYGRHEVVVAYPNDYRYGSDMRRDMFDVIDEDRRVIDEAIGPTAYGSLTNHRNWHDGDWYSVEVGEAVSFLILSYRHFFHETTPA